MTQKKTNKALLIISVVFYILGLGAMILGSVNDLKIDMVLFNPENGFARFMESFGQFVYWGMWGPAFTIIFLCRRDLNESLAVISKLLPKVKPVENTDGKAYKLFNTIIKVLTAVAFFALSVIGWKKLIENVLKNILIEAGKDDLSQVIYFVICAVVAVAAIFICSKINKETLRKLEALALAGVLLGIFYKIVENCKGITNRVRFREMVAYSNGFLNDKGLSEGKHSPLTSVMQKNADFSAFTPWYKIGDDMGIYNRSDSFPSGHTNYSCTMLLSYPLCLAFNKLKSIAPLTLIISIAFTASMAISRMIAGAHYLTDVAGAALIGYSLFLIVYKIYTKFTEKNILH